ncbi:MAG: general secretion pathway protein GspK, partial [Planctomycetota bacterium]
GQALVLALVAIGFLTAIVGATSTMLLSHARISAHERHRQEAYYAARAGLEVGLNILKKDNMEYDALSDGWNVSGDAARGEIPTGTFHVGRSRGRSKHGIIDAERKLNINTATVSMLKTLSPRLTSDIARRIVERRQENLFGSNDELMHFWRNEIAESEDAPPTFEYLKHLTVYGNGTINVNTASPSVLRCVPGFSPDVVGQIIERRNGPDGEPGTGDDAPYKDLNTLRESVNINREEWQTARDWITTSSTSFIIRTGGRSRTSPEARASTRSVVIRTPQGLSVVEHYRDGFDTRFWESQP